MLIGLVTVVPSSETERPWCFFLIFPPSCACSCVEWAVSDTHHAARPSPASSQRANQSPGLGGSAQGFAFWKSSGRYRAGSAPGTGSWAAPGNLLSFPRLAWFSLYEFLPPALCTTRLAVQVAPKPSFPARETQSSFLSSPSLQFPHNLVSHQPLSEPFRILS